MPRIATDSAKSTALPPNLPPRGLTQGQAAAYMGVSVATFMRRVRAGIYPQPIQDGGRLIFDRLAIDEWFDQHRTSAHHKSLDDAIAEI